MRLSINWLREFVDLNVSEAELADKLTLAGLEVEALERYEVDFSGVVAGRVTRVERHPQADRLQIAEVEDGRRTYRVVCGAPNLQAGVLYPFAPPGAAISGEREIKAMKLRAVASEGMLLAEDELGLSADHAGLMEIPQDMRLGQDIGEALKLRDMVLEVAVTPNRPDCLSIMGLAREVAALLGQPLHHPEIDFPEIPPPIGELAQVTTLAPVHCPRYAARLLVNLKVQPSPFWLRRRLQLAGLRSINNLVDVTNYVLLEFGQPLHAFDFDRLAGGEIVVRLPHEGEVSFVTLDSQERLLDQETLLICDAERPVALAGIMGGLDSEVTGDTHRVLIESAYFNPRTIRRTAKRLGLSTEASYRFERGVDPDGVIRALERATQLMAALGGGQVLAGRLDVYPQSIPRPRLTLRVARANAVLGTAFSPEKIQGILRNLHLPVVAGSGDTLEVQVPSFRGDLEREEDLIEEVARIAGYDQIPVTLPRGIVASARPSPAVRLGQEAQDLLLGLGFFEVTTYSFQSERLSSLLAEPESSSSALHLANPLSEEQAVMRTSPLPGLLEALRRNTLKQTFEVRLFEQAKIFVPKPGAPLPEEIPCLAGIMYGSREEPSWLAAKEAADFFDLKGVAETLLAGLRIPEVSFLKEPLPGFLQYGAKVYSRDLELGFLGKLTPQVGETLDVPGPILVFQLWFDALYQAAEPFPLYTPLPRYPVVYRDMALVLPASVTLSQVTQALYQYGQPWLEDSRLFDVYSGPPIPPGKRSLAFRLSYRDPERTLTDEIVNEHHDRLVKTLGETLGAELR